MFLYTLIVRAPTNTSTLNLNNMKKCLFIVPAIAFLMLFPLSHVLAEAAADSGSAHLTLPVSVLPKPVKLSMERGTLLLQNAIVLVYSEADTELQRAATFMADELAKKTGLRISWSGEPSSLPKLILRRWQTAHKEGYKLHVNEKEILLEAADYNGALYGMQTLLQLFPPAVYGQVKMAKYSLPCVKVIDYPRFGYRGMHLDVSRHFFNAQEVKQYIDLIAMHKMNVFHWHLTDDQGWRMESKKYPLLTQISAWRVDRRDVDWRARQPIQPGESPTYGGFYTQDEIREVVAYAAARGIEVIPEIELPGHSSEVFAAYPHLSCSGKKQEVSPGGYYKDLQTCFCAGNEDVFTFLQDILEETMALFPSKYIHIGADEVNKSFWKKCPKCQARMTQEQLKSVDELQSYFVKRMEKFINSKGKNLIGWDEIIEGGLAPNATVMSWRGMSGGIEGAKSGHDVIMTPENYIYLDYYQNLPDKEPVAIGGLNTVQSIYNFDPVPVELNDRQAKHILGAQANVWCEWILTFDHVQYMVLPRMTALSEVVWSPKKSRDYIDFSKRLEMQRARFSFMGMNAHPNTSLIDIQVRKTWRGMQVYMTPEKHKAQIRYTLDGSVPTLQSPVYSKPLKVKKYEQIRAKAFDAAWSEAPVFFRAFGKHLAYNKPVTLLSPSTGRHSARPEQLVDGQTASYRYADQEYQCVYGKNFEAVIDLKKVKSVRSVAGSFLYYAPNRIHIPVRFEVYASKNGNDFVKVDQVVSGFDPFSCRSAKQMLEVKAPFEARFIKVIAVNETIPEGLVGAGRLPAIFCDELFVF